MVLLPLVGLAVAACTLPGPDLSAVRGANTTVYARTTTTVSLTVTNNGTGPAPAVTVSYSPGQPAVSGLTSGLACTPVNQGHSGRGGGITRVGWSCAQSPAVALAAGASEVLQFSVTYPIGTFNEIWTVGAGSTSQLNLVSHTATATITSAMPPVPSAPTGVTVSQSGDDLAVGWQPPAVGADAITSSTLTATPVGAPSDPTLTATVSGASTSAPIVGVQPATTYSVTVHSTDAAGSGPESDPATFLTEVATVPPQAPSDVQTSWPDSTTPEIVVTWIAPDPGNSPIDDYQVSATGTGTIVTDAGTATEAVIVVPEGADAWTVTVRAHNAAGWSEWSTPVTQGAP
jgi:hypothetical protein